MKFKFKGIWHHGSCHLLKLFSFAVSSRLANIGEELYAEWIRCATTGSTRPKADFMGGLLPTAFTKEEISKLENYAQPTVMGWRPSLGLVGGLHSARPRVMS